MDNYFFIIYAILLIFILMNTYSYSTSTEINSKLRILIRQAARWSTAARQDQNPMIALLHANYGAGYLWAAKDIATENQIEKATNIDIVKFTSEIVKTQDTATKNMIRVCPEFGPDPTYLTKIGGEGI